VAAADKPVAAGAFLPARAAFDKWVAAAAGVQPAEPLRRQRLWRRSRDILYKPAEPRARTAGKST
jgi:hypothetical protein